MSVLETVAKCTLQYYFGKNIEGSQKWNDVCTTIKTKTKQGCNTLYQRLTKFELITNLTFCQGYEDVDQFLVPFGSSNLKDWNRSK